MSNLLPGESLVLKEHPHWITLVKSLVIPVLFIVVVGLAGFTFLAGSGQLRSYVILVALAIVLLWLIVVWARWRSITYTLTDQRIKIEMGVFGRSEKVIPIDRVQDCTTRQSVVGRIFGYGTVEVDAAGAQGAEVLAHLPSPGSFRDQVFMLSERRRVGGVPSAHPVSANPSGV